MICYFYFDGISAFDEDQIKARFHKHILFTRNLKTGFRAIVKDERKLWKLGLPIIVLTLDILLSIL